MPSAPAPWEATDGGWAWRILYDPDLPVPASPEPAVLPGLVTIGQRDGKSVLVDLEALGSLAITGDSTAAENLARSILVELAAGDDLANSYVHAVGIDLDGLPHLDRARARDETSGLELLHPYVATTTPCSNGTGCRPPSNSASATPPAGSSPSSPHEPAPSTTSTG